MTPAASGGVGQCALALGDHHAQKKAGATGTYHCMASTYGTWLLGDDRGWHERNHYEHVSGDYKHPLNRQNSPAAAGNIHAISQETRPVSHRPRHSPLHWRMAESFRHSSKFVAAIAVAETNFHALLRYQGGNCKIILGRAKATPPFDTETFLHNQHRRPIWGDGSLPKPIKTRSTVTRPSNTSSNEAEGA